MPGSSESHAQRSAQIVFNGLLLLLSVGAVVLIFEIGLRVFADVPNPFRVDGKDSGEYVFSPLRQRTLNKYVPYRYGASTRVVRPDPEIMPGLSPEVTFTVDRFGFRGTRATTLEKPDGTTRIVVVGGSTTECRDLDDSEAWPELLHQALSARHPGSEVLNAGFSGDTSRDHIAQLAQQLVAFEPDVALFLVGINDLDLQMKPDYSILREDSRSQFVEEPPPFLLMLKVWGGDWSHLVRLGIWASRQFVTQDEKGNPVQDLRGDWMAERREQLRQLPLREIDPRRWPTPEYEQNVRTLVGISRAHGIEPILITQPVLWGAPPGDWEKLLWVAPDPEHRIAHPQLWQVMERFNDVLRDVGTEEDVLVIDLARKLPKTTEIFYDDDHYTIEGSKRVAEIVAGEMQRLGWTDRLAR